MPKMLVTQAERELVLRERHRLELDNRDWSREPVLTDRNIAHMSMHVVQYVLTNAWLRDECAMLWRNVTHPDNREWYLDRVATDIARGTIKLEAIPELLLLLPDYTKDKP